ncbi:MAG: PAS domain-containing sensor histidine kinase [Cyanobacteria bacterium J06560_2]
MLLGFIVGLGVGAIALIINQRRCDANLRRLLGRLEDRQLIPAFGYDAQLASAIGEQQAQLETLNTQLQNFRQLLQSAPVGYLQVDDESRLLWCNTRAQEFLDIDQGEYTQPRLLLAVVRSYELDQLIDRTRETQQVCEASWTFNSISTDPFNYLERPAYPLQGYGVPMEKGQVGVFLENRQEAVMLAQQRDRWISDVAHELKTPLTSIRLVAETLQSRVAPNLVTWVDRLLKEVIRLSVLVDDVMQMSSLEKGRTPAEAESDADLVRLIDAAWQSVEPLAKLKYLSLDYRGPDHLIVTMNARLIHSVLFNLFSNAMKYSPAHEAIYVRLSLLDSLESEPLLDRTVSANSPQLLLEVMDAGDGFSAKDLPHVFDRFYRGDLARSRMDAVEPSGSDAQSSVDMAALVSGGTGLGLSIVRQIVEAHQGRVEAKNHPEYGGAWLSVWFPGERLMTVDSEVGCQKGSTKLPPSSTTGGKPVSGASS